MLARVTCLTLGANFSNFKTPIAPMEHVNRHLSARQCAWGNMRCLQILDVNISLFDIKTSEFSSTEETRNEHICIYHYSPNATLEGRGDFCRVPLEAVVMFFF